MKQMIINVINQNKTRAYRSQPMPLDYSQTKWADNFSIVTKMQEAFMQAVIQ